MLLIGNLLISPLLATIAPAAVTAVGSLLGGVLNAGAQSRANQTNLQATRETNAMTEELAREQMSRQESQFQRQLEYLSPKEQRRMIEEAGYSPMAYLNGGQTSSAGTPHTGVSQGFQSSHVQPVTAFGDSLQQISANIRNIAEARKLDSEKKGQDLQNDVFMTQFEKTMEALGYSNKIAEVKAKYAGQEEEEFYKSLVNQNLMAVEDIERLKIANKIQREYNEKIQPQELNKLLAEIDNLKAGTETQSHMQSYYDAAAKAGLTNAAANSLMAWVRKQEMPSEIAVNEATKKEIDERREYQTQVNSVYRAFGAKTADAILEGYNKGAWRNEEEAHAYLRKNAGISDTEFNTLKEVAPYLLGLMFMRGTPNPVRGFNVRGFGK